MNVVATGTRMACSAGLPSTPWAPVQIRFSCGLMYLAAASRANWCPGDVHKMMLALVPYLRATPVANKCDL